MTGVELPKLAVYASHSALQILQGSRAEGLRTVIYGPADRLRFYRRFPQLLDEAIECAGVDCLNFLVDRGCIFIPSGSTVEYLGYERLLKLNIPFFGLKEIIKWERDWRLKMDLLKAAGLPTPKAYSSNDEIVKTVMVKMPGAKGGAGYFISTDSDEVRRSIDRLVEEHVLEGPEDACIQEYVVGTTLYAHYFQSPIMDRLELTGFDIRYESNVDGMRRLPPRIAEGIKPSFVVTGNLPVYPRESLLERFMEYGEKFVEATRRLMPPGIIGPFSLETVVTEDLEPVVFEFSGRIVAGTNVYLAGSPYLELYWGERMTVGRRIAKEIKLAALQGRLSEVVT